MIGLQEGVITSNSSFPCDKSIVGCHPGHHASNISEAVQFSCNPYFYAVMRRITQQNKLKNMNADAEMGLNNWHKYMLSFGLGQVLETDVSGLRSGLIPNSKYSSKCL